MMKWVAAIAKSTTLVCAIKEWTCYHVFWDKRLPFVLGMVFGRSLAKNAVVNVLMWYLSIFGDNLVRSAILSNFQEGLSSVLKIVIGHVADSIIGRFRTLRFSTSAYIGGLMLLWLFNPFDVMWLIAIMLVLISIGTSGDLILEDVLNDIVRQLQKSRRPNEERVLARSKIWLRICNACAAAVATLWVTPSPVIRFDGSPSWETVFLVCTIVMGISLLLFLVGSRFFHDNRLIDRPFHIFLRVLRAAILKRDLSYSTDPQNYFQNQLTTQPSTMPNLSCYRFLASAAKIPDGQTDKRALDCTLDEVVVVDHLLKMLPMWITFLVISLVSATGSTFFIEQFNNLKSPENVPIVIFTIIQDFSGFIIVLVYPKILAFCRCRFSKNQKVQMGLGMLCSILCCVLAWQLEVRRLRRVNNQLDPNESTDISFVWLIPQFCVLGFMEGLAEDGLLEFFKSQVDKSISNNGTQYIEFVMGIGKLVSIIFVLAFKQRGWINGTINDSRLDKYYKTLSFICLVNLVIYCTIAAFVYKDDGSPEESSNDDSQAGDQIISS